MKPAGITGSMNWMWVYINEIRVLVSKDNAHPAWERNKIYVMIWITKDAKVTSSSRNTARDFYRQRNLKVKFAVRFVAPECWRLCPQNSLTAQGRRRAAAGYDTYLSCMMLYD